MRVHANTGRSAVEGAHDAWRAAVDDVRVDHRRAHVLVAQERLDRAEVGAGFEQVGGEAVAEGVAARALRDARGLHRVTDGPLHRALVEVVEHAAPRGGVGGQRPDPHVVLPEVREPILKDIRNAVEVAKRVNAKWCTVVPGCHDERLDWDYQTASVVDMFRRCADIVEKAGLVMVMEPLNTRRDHPKLFLTKISQAYAICRAADRPSVKILYDMYHQQITEGNIIPNIDLAYDEVAYFQVGDNPGRKEPTTGEMNYRNIFKHIHSKGFKGVVGMEHGVKDARTKEGEMACIEAYAWCDNF